MLLAGARHIVAMFIRKATRKYKGQVYTNYQLVRSVQTPKGPRQKMICSLGDLNPRPAEAWRQLAHQIEDALQGQPGLFEGSQEPEVAQIVHQVQARQAGCLVPAAGRRCDAGEDLIAVHADRVQVEYASEAGPVHVGYQFWKRLGLDEILRSLEFSEPAIRLTCAMALNRLIHPASEHAMPGWIRSTALEDMWDMDFQTLCDDRLYRNLDRLYPIRAAIESALVQRERSLFNLEPTVFFYDLTSTYFEGQALANPKAKRGYSRDHRPDCKQVVIGLAIGREGFPLAHEIFAGNVQDEKTLGTMLDRMKARVGLAPGATVVVDRGMAYAENLQEIRDRHLHYVVAARQPERDQWLDDFEDPEGFEEMHREPSPRNPCQHKSEVRVKLLCKGDERFVLCTSSQRVAKDRAIREKQELRFLADVEKLRQRIAKGRLVREVAIGEAIGRIKNVIPAWLAITCSPTTPLAGSYDTSRTKRRGPRRNASTVVTCCVPTAGSHRSGSLALVHHADSCRGGIPGDEEPLGRAADLPSTGATGGNAHLPLRAGVPSSCRHRDDARQPRPAHFLVFRPRGTSHAPGGHDRPAHGRRPDTPHPQGNYSRTRARCPLPTAECSLRNHSTSKNLEHPAFG